MMTVRISAWIILTKWNVYWIAILIRVVATMQLVFKIVVTPHRQNDVGIYSMCKGHGFT